MIYHYRCLCCVLILWRRVIFNIIAGLLDRDGLDEDGDTLYYVSTLPRMTTYTSDYYQHSFFRLLPLFLAISCSLSRLTSVLT